MTPSFSLRTPEDDALPRKICDTCGFVAYENPKIVVGSVVRHDGKILLCKRAIEPRKGFWTIPAGYLELNETPEDGARREAREEAEAALTIERLLAVYAVPRISQVQLIYRARLAEASIAAGPESQAVDMFARCHSVGRAGLSLGPLGVEPRSRGGSRRAAGAVRQSRRRYRQRHARWADTQNRRVLTASLWPGVTSSRSRAP